MPRASSKFRRPKFRLLYPHALEDSYRRALLPVSAACQRALEDVYLPTLGSLGLPTNKVHMDAMASVELSNLAAAGIRHVLKGFDHGVLTKLLAAKAKDVSKYQLKQLTGHMVAATGIQALVGALEAPAAETELVKGFVSENVALIESIPEAFFSSVERKVRLAVKNGTRVETLRDQLMATTDVSKSKASLIARDQVGKLYGDLNQARQGAVGIKSYIWRTLDDSRVRATHEKLDGKVYAWDSPPVTNKQGGRNHPGKDIQCRCSADPNLDELNL